MGCSGICQDWSDFKLHLKSCQWCQLIISLCLPHLSTSLQHLKTKPRRGKKRLSNTLSFIRCNTDNLYCLQAYMYFGGHSQINRHHQPTTVARFSMVVMSFVTITPLLSKSSAHAHFWWWLVILCHQVIHYHQNWVCMLDFNDDWLFFVITKSPSLKFSAHAHFYSS